MFDQQSDPHNLDPLPPLDPISTVEYRIAYMTICVENNMSGIPLISDLRNLCQIDNEYIQFGCAEWFWERQINSYVIQVEPERHKMKDRCVVGCQEAQHPEDERSQLFEAVDRLLFKMECETGS